MGQTKQERNVIRSVKFLLRKLNIKVSNVGVEQELCMHPDFPSIASISDALTQWNVENIVAKLDLYKVTEIPLPALAFMNTRGGSFVILTSVA